MLRKSLSILAIVLFITSLSISAYAGNNKTEQDSGINPAGKSNKNGFDNGNAWWKHRVAELEAQVIFLQDDVQDLEDQLANQVCPEPIIVQSTLPEQTWEAEPRKFAIYKTSSDHPNTPDAYGVYANFFIPGTDIQNLIAVMESGSYEVNIEVVDPDGNLVNIETVLEAQKIPRAYYDNYVELVP